MKMEVYKVLTGERIAVAPGVAFVETPRGLVNCAKGPEWVLHMVVGNEKYLIGQEYYPNNVDGCRFENAVLRYEQAMNVDNQPQ